MATLETAVNAGDTFDRSCAHWSEQARQEMEDFYVLAVEDYRQLAISFGWAAWLKDHERRTGERALHLLDVACGSGKFPSALQKYAKLATSRLNPIQYDLLDPTSFALEEARGVLQPPFDPGQDYLCRLQDLDGAQSYDVIWATHALYALPPNELQSGLEKFVEALAPGGAGFIAHACEDAHYLQFYRIYLKNLKQGTGTPYTSAEQIINTLYGLGVSVEVRDINYECRAPLDRRSEVEGYLQRCLFDNTLGLSEMLENPALASYLNTCRNSQDWCFRQHVKMMFFSV
jgi:SAM-dependent methyltransferase